MTEETWVVEQNKMIFSQSISTVGSSSEDAARTLALEDAERTAEATCGAFEASDLYKLVNLEIKPSKWDCVSYSTGHYCGFDGDLVCSLERLERIDSEVCGTGE